MNKKNIVILGLLIIGLVILLNQNNQLRGDVKELEELSVMHIEMIENNENTVNKLVNSYNEALKANKSLEIENNSLNQSVQRFEMLDTIALTELREKGIEDYKLIENDLMEKSELITIEGILGGTMYFRDVRLLNDQWAYATFDDGHIMGAGLYKFSINNSQDIDWEEIIAVSD